MQGNTHRLGGVTAALGGFIVLDHYSLTLDDVNPLLQLAVVYPFAIYGSTCSDLDHHEGSIPSRDVFSLAVNKVLHLGTKPRRRMAKNRALRKTLGYKFLGLFDAKHRAWQTHSDLTFVTVLALLWYLCFSGYSPLMGTDRAITALILTGLALGILAHIFLDGITPEGIWWITGVVINRIFRRKILPEKVGLVPRKPVMVKGPKGDPVSYFATGGPWENLVNRLLKAVTWVIFFYIIYLSQPYRIEFEWRTLFA